MACKFEEVLYYPTNLFVKNAKQKSITKQSILQMERDILEALQFKIIFIGPLDILKRLTILTKTNKEIGKIQIFIFTTIKILTKLYDSLSLTQYFLIVRISCIFFPYIASSFR